MGLFDKLFRANRDAVDINNPKCSLCSKALGEADSIFGGARVVTTGSQSLQEIKDDYVLFRGSVCFKCKTVLCMNCNHGIPHTCPKCNGQTDPAYRRHLRELDQIHKGGKNQTMISKIVAEKPTIDAPKGVYCVLCKSRYSIDECIEPRVPEGRIITFTCPKCKVPRAYDPSSDKGL